MNGKSIVMFVLTTVVATSGGMLFAQEDLRSLRGMNPIEENSVIPDSKRWEPDSSPIQREFVQQPPLIPHDTKGYQINLKFNKCLTCHSWANYEESRATKISQTHFTNRDGVDLANVSAGRYFCTQCHVGQRDAKPLVENEFEAVDVLQ